MSTKNNAKKVDKKRQIAAVELLPVEKTARATLYDLALARVDALVRSSSGACRGVLPERLASHESAWQNLLKEDHVTRDQILQLKMKENEVLSMIRDRVAENLMETIDTAAEQGILRVPEEV
jgi:hypothetical protein